MAQATAPILDSTIASVRGSAAMRPELGVKQTCQGHRPRAEFDPQRTNAAAMQQFFGTSAALSGSVLCAGVSVARAT